MVFLILVFKIGKYEAYIIVGLSITWKFIMCALYKLGSICIVYIPSVLTVCAY